MGNATAAIRNSGEGFVRMRGRIAGGLDGVILFFPINALSPQTSLQDDHQRRKRVLPKPFHVDPQALDHLAVKDISRNWQGTIGSIGTESIELCLPVYSIEDPVFPHTRLLILAELLFAIASAALRTNDFHRQVRWTFQVQSFDPGAVLVRYEKHIRLPP